MDQLSFLPRWCVGSDVPGDHLDAGHLVSDDFEDIAWIERRGWDTRAYPKGRCIRCEQKRRNYVNSRDEDVTKARRWIARKSAKCGTWWNCTPAEARRRFELQGVTVISVAAIFRDARLRGTCPSWERGGCGEPFDGGEHDLTGDVKDPREVESRGYLTLEDIHGQCNSCNNAKGPKTWPQWLRQCAYHHWCDELQEAQ